MGIFNLFGKKTIGPKEVAKKEPTRVVFVLLRRAEPPDLSRADEVVERVLGPGHSTETSDGGILVVMRGEDLVGMIAHMPAPIPEDEAAHHADHNFLWENGRQEAATHKSHAIVTNMGGGGKVGHIESALGLAKLCLVALDLLDGVGVYWGSGSICNSREVFESFCENMSEKHMPLPVMLRFQFVQAEDGKAGMYTLGMDQFGLMEIEVDRSPLNPQDLFGFVTDLAHYMVLSGHVVEDGNTVGGSEQERILVRHQPSMIDKKRLVYKVIYES